MQHAPAILRSANLVSQDKHNRLIVVSASAGTTDQLTELGSVAMQNLEHANEILAKIAHHHKTIVSEIELSTGGSLKSCSEALDLIVREARNLCHGIFYLKDCSPKTKDQLLAIGERLSAEIFSATLCLLIAERSNVIDARLLIETNDHFGQAVPQYEAIARKVKESLLKLLLDGSGRFVTQGFIGSTSAGVTTTLGRGGSDFSAAILAEAVGAFRLKIYTDVPGIATTDPRLVPHASIIHEISFHEAAELSVFGAKVLHPSTLVPAVRSDIPVEVNTSMESGHLGTLIQTNVQNPPLVRALSLKSNQSILTITNPKMLEAWGFLASVFTVFKKHRVSVDLVTTSEISIAINLNDSDISNYDLIRELEELGTVDIEVGLAIVALVGNSITHTNGLARLLFSELDDVNIRMVCMGASSHNICFLVKASEAQEVVRRLHRIFLEKDAPREVQA